VFPPLLNDDLCLLQGVEDLPIEQFIPEAGIKPLSLECPLSAKSGHCGWPKRLRLWTHGKVVSGPKEIYLQ
jgi:hypothetical protein